MSENAKKGALIAVVIVALAAAGFGLSKFMAGDQPEVVQTIQGSGKSEKDLALEQSGAAGGGEAGGKVSEERDLSGAGN